jgi:hypothetical protein
MFLGNASNHKGNYYSMWNPNTKKVSETREVVFLKRMFYRIPTKPVHKKLSNGNEDLNSVQQDKRGGTITADFVTGNDDNAATVKSIDSYVPDTTLVNKNPGQSRYGRTYRCTMQYNPTTGHTIGAEVTALANYY